MIKSMSKEQESLIPKYCEKWRAAGWSTEPCDPETVEKVLRELVFSFDTGPLKDVRLLPSPMACIEAVFRERGLEKPEYVSPTLNGATDAYWVCLYDFSTVLGVTYKEINKLEAYKACVQNCGPVYFHNGVAFASDRPERLSFDDEKRLHCVNGPAVLYRDGYSVYAWHGVRIPREWIEDTENALTPAAALTWDNLDQRAAACEILGWHRIIDGNESYELLDKEDDPERGALVSIELPDHGRQKFLRVKCGTGRDFALMVPDKNDENKPITTVYAAQAALAGLPEQLFQYPTERT